MIQAKGNQEKANGAACRRVRQWKTQEKLVRGVISERA